MKQLLKSLEQHCASMQELIKIRNEELTTFQEELETETSINKSLKARIQVLQSESLAYHSTEHIDLDTAFEDVWETLQAMIEI